MNVRNSTVFDVAAAMSLSALPGVGSVKLRKLLMSLNGEFAGISDLLDGEEIKNVLDLQDQQISALQDGVEHNLSLASELIDSEWQLITMLHPAWPKKAASPKLPWMYVKGDISLLDRTAVAIAGARDAAASSLKTTREIVESLVDHDFVIVSGGAKGVDFNAHEAALERGGRTIAVVAQGAGSVRVSDEWGVNQVLLVSEFTPSDPWTPYRAMQRNKTIIGLSEALVVVQAGAKGGTFNAGKCAIELGVPLLIVDHEQDQFDGNVALLRMKGSQPLPWPTDESPAVSIQRLLRQQDDLLPRQAPLL